MDRYPFSWFRLIKALEKTAQESVQNDPLEALWTNPIVRNALLGLIIGGGISGILDKGNDRYDRLQKMLSGATIGALAGGLGRYGIYSITGS